MMAGWQNHARHEDGFTLVEVALAVGVFVLTVVTVLGLLGPAVQQIRLTSVHQTANNHVGTFNAYLATRHGEPEGSSRAWAEMFRLTADGPALFYIYNGLDGNPAIRAEAGAVREVDGSLLVARVSVSGLNPRRHLRAVADYYVMEGVEPETYPEACLVLRVDFHTVPTPPPGTALAPVVLGEANLLFTYHTAVMR